jgi:hypothetical protein
MNLKCVTFLYSHYVPFGYIRLQVVAIMVMCEDTEPGILYKDICISYTVRDCLKIAHNTVLQVQECMQCSVSFKAVYKFLLEKKDQSPVLQWNE